MALETTPLLTSILEIHSLSSGAHLALIGLISFRNKSTGLCCPRIATLSERLGAPYRTVSRWLNELRAAGIVESTRHRGSNSYRIDLSKNHGKAEAPGEPDMPEVAGLDMPKVADLDRPKVAGLGPRILNEQTVSNRQITTKAAADVKLEAVRKPVQKAAAAAQDSFAFEEEREQNQHPAPEALTMAEMVVAELMPQHPEPGNEPKAVAEAAKILAAKPEEMAATVETMRQTHAASRLSWANYRADRFIPQLWRWFSDGDWKYLRAARKEVQRETYNQRQRRELEEVGDETCRMYAELDMWDEVRAYGGDDAVEVWREKIQQAS
jgi:DNA-binding transcriptional ArsR family regulator